jgi:hypothetical protein
LGNVLKEPLALIRQRGLQVKELREFSSVCLAGEQCEFSRKYMTKTFSATSFPMRFEEGFYDLAGTKDQILTGCDKMKT